MKFLKKPKLWKSVGIRKRIVHYFSKDIELGYIILLLRKNVQSGCKQMFHNGRCICFVTVFTLSRSDVSWDTVLFKVVIILAVDRNEKNYMLHMCNLLLFGHEILQVVRRFLWKIIQFFFLFFSFLKIQISSHNKWTHSTLIFLFNFWLVNAFCDADIRIQHEKNIVQWVW